MTGDPTPSVAEDRLRGPPADSSSAPRSPITMATLSPYQHLLTFLLVWAAMLNAGTRSWAVSAVSLGLMAVYVTDWIMKALRNALPRKYLEEVKNKAVFITGCDSGFGHELARKLDKIGYKVYAGCLSPEGEGAVTLKAECSSLLTVLPLDVTKDEDVKAAYNTVRKTLGDRVLWAVVNNAGVGSFTEIEWCPLDTFRRCLDVNTLGPIRVTKTFLPLVREAEGRVVIVTSLADRFSLPGLSAYAMSKHAALSFADALRLEMHKFNVSVHIVEPTLYKTPITNDDPYRRNLDDYWKDCSKEVKESYGDEYLKDFKDSVTNHLNHAKPCNKVHEVIEDLIHAVTGVDPQMRYVPSVITQVRVKLLSTLPLQVRDSIFLTQQPSTPPAIAAKKKKRRDLQNPKRLLKPSQKLRERHYSMPNWEKSEITPPFGETESKFVFDCNESAFL